MLAQRETPQTTPPPVPGPDAREVRCKCGALLGFVAGGWFHSRHKGRGIDAHLPARVLCDKCGHKTAVLDTMP